VNRAAKIALAVVAGCVLLAVALYGVDVRRVRDLIIGVRIPWLVIALILYVTAYVVRSLRWRLILKPVVRVRVSESFFMLMAGYFLNYIIPIRAGEVAKAFFLRRLKGTPVAASLPTVFVDKLLELFSIVFVILLVPVISIRLSGYLTTLIAMVLVVFVVALVVLLLALRNEESTTRFLSRSLSWLPAHVHARLSGWLGLFVQGMGVVLQNARAAWGLLGLTALAVLIDAVYFSCMFRAFSMEVPFAQVLFGYTLISLSYILPTPPAQIGHNEAVMVIIFATGFGLGQEEVTAVMILAHVLTGLIVTGVGLASFAAMSIRLGESFRHVTGRGGEEAEAGSEPGAGRSER
jgi:uncharacterized protein (TIRG00374 family)